MNRWFRLALALLIAVVLGTPTAFADSYSGRVPRLSGMLASVPAERFADLWNFLTSLWAKNGCEVDPNGRCLAAQVGGKNGCQVDPSGNCLPGTGPARLGEENGCQVDPNGRCGK